MGDVRELYALLRRSAPYVVRAESEALRVLGMADAVFERRDGDGMLCGAAAMHGGTIYMLCVLPEYRRRGIGSALLDEAERHAAAIGCGSVVIGADGEYIAPGVPTSEKPYAERLGEEAIWPGLDDSAAAFFMRRGYRHRWGEANCFDMRMDMGVVPEKSAPCPEGIEFMLAGPGDVGDAVACAEDGWEEFARYYADASLYVPGGKSRVLLAREGSTAVGALIVSAETEGTGVGSVGCTVVRTARRGRGIAAGLVWRGSEMLRAAGMKSGFLGYTYSGLDRLYGAAGYKICAYYLMAEKNLR